MMNRIDTIKNIDAPHVAKLDAVGISTTDALLERCGSVEGRKTIATKTGIGEDLLLKWVNNADLMRLQGVEPEFSQLLESAGVATVIELKGRLPEKLHAKLTEVNTAKKLARRTPTLQEVQTWITSAQAMPPRVFAA